MPLTVQAITLGVNFSASGNNTVLAASATSQIFLRGVGLVINGATTLTFNGQEGSFGPFVFPSAGTLMLDDIYDSAQSPYAEFPVNTGIVINSSAAVQVSGFLRYSLG